MTKDNSATIIKPDDIKIDDLCVNTIRTLAMDAIEQANSGHPGAPMGLAAAGYVLWTRILKHNPKNPDWPDRDRFVLSGGHASMLLYSLLHLCGYDISLDDIKQFRQWQSKTPGHPEYGHTPGIETTTGPLGQGFANAVGMAMAERHLAARFNKGADSIVGHYTYMMCGDGDLMEGISCEAASLAGHLGLGKLICIYDANKISIEGSIDIAFSEDVALRFKACNWHVISVGNGNDLNAIQTALEESKSRTDKPSLIILRTHIAYGSPNKQDTADAHGAPLGEDEIRLTKKRLNWPADKKFAVPAKALAVFRKCLITGEKAETAWKQKLGEYTKKHPDLANQWVNALSAYLENDWADVLPQFKPADGPMATRAASGKALNSIAGSIPTLMGGSADLAPSNKTYLDDFSVFSRDNYPGRNIRFGVREHAMAAIMAGMFLHNGIRPYGGTFLVFADYMRPAIRMASLMKLPLIYIFTHDSIAVGEDGPTHQPVEHLAALRSIPRLIVLRPADATETNEAWRQAIISSNAPVALILSRQKLPVLDSDQTKKAFANGAYILDDCKETPDLILIASGSEVHIALSAKEELTRKKIRVRVVSMPSWELFEKTSQSYKDSVLLPQVSARIAIEAGLSMGWERYVGNRGLMIGMENFGASAPGNILMEQFGFTSKNIIQKALTLLGKS